MINRLRNQVANFLLQVDNAVNSAIRFTCSIPVLGSVVPVLFSSLSSIKGVGSVLNFLLATDKDNGIPTLKLATMFNLLTFNSLINKDILDTFKSSQLNIEKNILNLIKK